MQVALDDHLRAFVKGFDHRHVLAKGAQNFKERFHLKENRSCSCWNWIFFLQLIIFLLTFSFISSSWEILFWTVSRFMYSLLEIGGIVPW